MVHSLRAPVTSGAMATLTPDGLQALLAKAGIDDPIPDFPLADTLNSPLDIYHAYLAETLVGLSRCERDAACQSVDAEVPSDLSDLIVVLPRLRVQDVNQEELAYDLLHRVRVRCFCYLA